MDCIITDKKKQINTEDRQSDDTPARYWSTGRTKDQITFGRVSSVLDQHREPGGRILSVSENIEIIYAEAPNADAVNLPLL
jgi:hypothetical protein